MVLYIVFISTSRRVSERQLNLQYIQMWQFKTYQKIHILTTLAEKVPQLCSCRAEAVSVSKFHPRAKNYARRFLWTLPLVKKQVPCHRVFSIHTEICPNIRITATGARKHRRYAGSAFTFKSFSIESRKLVWPNAGEPVLYYMNVAGLFLQEHVG